MAERQAKLMKALRVAGYGAAAALGVVLVAAGLVLLVSGPEEGEPGVAQPTARELPVADGGVVIPDQYIVVFDEVSIDALSRDGEGVPSAMVAKAVVTRYGGDVHYTYDYAIKGFAGTLTAEAVAALKDDPLVTLVEPNTVVTALATESPVTWGLDRIDQRQLPLNDAYTYDNTGRGVNAYIIDTGIRSTHREFTGRLGDGYNAVDDNNGTEDCNGHGTHVAGTVGGTVFGVAKDVTLHAVRVLNCRGSGTVAGVIAGVDWVTANHVAPSVANMSLGGGASAALDKAVQNAIASGITFALAAGNSNGDACATSPARVPEAITVGASTRTDARASFSNKGSCVDLFAPGADITSSSNGDDEKTATLSGTSMASPHVAGAAALYVELHPDAAPAEVAAALVENATNGVLTDVGRDSPNKLLYVGDAPNLPTPEPTATATPRPTATPTNTPSPTPVDTPVQEPEPTGTAEPVPARNLVVNGDFEAAEAVWEQRSALGYPLVCDNTLCEVELAPHSGSFLTWLGGANREQAQISQPVKIPAEAAAARLEYWLRIESKDACGYDHAEVTAIVNDESILLRRYDLCRDTATSGWSREEVDLSALAGNEVTLLLRAETDIWLVSSLFVDDVRLLIPLATDVPSPTPTPNPWRIR